MPHPHIELRGRLSWLEAILASLLSEISKHKQLDVPTINAAMTAAARVFDMGPDEWINNELAVEREAARQEIQEAEEEKMSPHIEVITKSAGDTACACCHRRIGAVDDSKTRANPGVVLGQPSFRAPAINVCRTCLRRALELLPNGVSSQMNDWERLRLNTDILLAAYMHANPYAVASKVTALEIITFATERRHEAKSKETETKKTR